MKNKMDGQSLLPMNIVDENNKIIEIILCSNISGGKDYSQQNHSQPFMPNRLTLVRQLDDGKEIVGEYFLIEHI